jgi:hypothetical protein
MSSLEIDDTRFQPPSGQENMAEVADWVGRRVEIDGRDGGGILHAVYRIDAGDDQHRNAIIDIGDGQALVVDYDRVEI